VAFTLLLIAIHLASISWLPLSAQPYDQERALPVVDLCKVTARKQGESPPETAERAC
jgi:hypothetical protein